MVTVYEPDPDVARWGLYQLLGVCSLSNGGSHGTFTYYDKDLSRLEYVREGYCESNSINVENDEVIAHTLQNDLSRLGSLGMFGYLHAGEVQPQASNDWLGQSNQYVLESYQAEECARGRYNSGSSQEERSIECEDQSCSPEMENENILDGEVGKRLYQMVPIRHVPKTNGELPSADEEISDHQRLMDRLQLYELVELKVSGDGNCQFRSLSDQIYRSAEHHEFVREQIVDQLKSNPELYGGYVPMAYDEYLKKMSKTGEWGDHVTLQAAADSFGVKIFVITSFKDTCYIEILPCVQKSKRIIFLSFWAEVHYNSIYPLGDMSETETRKKKSWWKLGC